MPKNPEPEGSPRLLTIDQIAKKHGVSRSSVHTYRRGGTFPRPVPVEGTTRVLFDTDEVAAWFLANPKQQGKRTDLTQPAQQGDPVTAQVEASAAAVLKGELLDRLYRSYGARDVHTMSAAQKLLAEYEAAVLREAADALDAGKSEFPADVQSGSAWAVRTLRRMAEGQAKDSDG